MMKTIQRTGVLLLLLVFLFGTTGISVFHHICSSSGQDNASVYPELFIRAGTSCCVDESTGYSCAHHETAAGSAEHHAVDAPPCCKSNLSFFKLEIPTERVEKLALNIDNAQLPLYPVILTMDRAAEQPPLMPAHFQFYSPPLFGKVLVHFLHQMKIPAHLSVA
ncbi:MAG: hypothetical protein NT040_15330 [Bacteroidetes bacterium]|nr:hypothetical protein [Bacteroidota bacterium]